MRKDTGHDVGACLLLHTLLARIAYVMIEMWNWHVEDPVSYRKLINRLLQGSPLRSWGTQNLKVSIDRLWRLWIFESGLRNALGFLNILLHLVSQDIYSACVNSRYLRCQIRHGTHDACIRKRPRSRKPIYVHERRHVVRANKHLVCIFLRGRGFIINITTYLDVGLSPSRPSHNSIGHRHGGISVSPP